MMKAKRNACRTKKELTARSRRAFSRRATFEPLEARHMMSAGNLFAEFVGTLTPAAPVERLDVQIAPEALGLMRDKALLGFELKGRDGQTFDPAAVQILRPDGSLVKPEFAADNVPGRTDSVVVAELAEGNYTIKVGGSLSARSQFFLDVFLVGDANGDHRVGRDDLDFIRANYGASAGDARYNLAADANLDGRITAIDLSLARRNESDSHAPVSVTPCGAGASSVEPSAAPAPLLATAADPSAPVAGIVPTRGYDPDAPMRFYESTYGLVQAMGENAVYQVPGEAGQTSRVVFSWDFREAGYNNELGYFYVDNADGAINIGTPEAPFLVSPGDDGYERYALAQSNSETVFASGEVQNGSQPIGKALDLQGGCYIAFYLVQNNTTAAYRTWYGNGANSQQPVRVWFSCDTANEDGYEHFQLTAPGNQGYVPNVRQYKVEDLSPTLSNPHGYQNDADYNDVVFSVKWLPSVSIVAWDALESGESGVPGGFIVRRTGATDNALPVSLSVGGTASNVTDYYLTDASGQNLASGSVTIPAGESSVAILVHPLDDGEPHDVKTVQMSISPGSAYASIASAASAAVTIREDDTTPVAGVIDLAFAEDSSANPWLVESTDGTDELMQATLTRLETVNVRVSLSGDAAFGPGKYAVQLIGSEGLQVFSDPNGQYPLSEFSLDAPADLRAVYVKANAAGDFTLTVKVVLTNPPPGVDPCVAADDIQAKFQELKTTMGSRLEEGLTDAVVSNLKSSADSRFRAILDPIYTQLAASRALPGADQEKLNQCEQIVNSLKDALATEVGDAARGMAKGDLSLRLRIDETKDAELINNWAKTFNSTPPASPDSTGFRVAITPDKNPMDSFLGTMAIMVAKAGSGQGTVEAFETALKNEVRTHLKNIKYSVTYGTAPSVGGKVIPMSFGISGVASESISDIEKSSIYFQIDLSNVLTLPRGSKSKPKFGLDGQYENKKLSVGLYLEWKY